MLQKATVKNTKPLIILLFLLLGDLFTNEALVVPCNLGNKGQVETRSLLDIKATGIAFINKKIMRHMYHVL